MHFLFSVTPSQQMVPCSILHLSNKYILQIKKKNTSMHSFIGVRYLTCLQQKKKKKKREACVCTTKKKVE